MSIIWNEPFGTPLASYAIVAILHDFEPPVSSGVVACGGVGDLLYIYGARALMIEVDGHSSKDGRDIRHGTVFKCEVGTRVDAGNTGHAGLAIYTCQGLVPRVIRG